jgi:hypothetical protein
MVHITLPIVVQTLDKSDGLWCPECEDVTAVTVTYTIEMQDDMAVGATTGCMDCGVIL